MTVGITSPFATSVYQHSLSLIYDSFRWISSATTGTINIVDNFILLFHYYLKGSVIFKRFKRKCVIVCRREKEGL
jgi:hypothetical protein